MVQALHSASRSSYKIAYSVWLFFLLLGLGSRLVQAQSTAPFNVRVTPAGPLSLPAGGSQVLTATATYPAFSVNGSTGFSGGNVNAVVVQKDGKILVGGSFTQFKGADYPYLARLNADGTLDTGFNKGTGPNAAITAIAMQSDGRILVGGSFSSYDGSASSNLVRLNTDGSLHTRFATEMEDTQLAPTRTIAAIVVQTDGGIVIGGSFTTFNGYRRNNLARFSKDGSFDVSFAPAYASNAGGVLALALQADGKILVGGGFGNYSTTGTTTNNNYIARYNKDGSQDSAFARPVVSNSPSPYSTYVTAIAVQADGRILLGGYINYTGNAVTNFLKRLKMDSSGNTDLDITTGYVGTNANQNTYNPSFRAILALQADGQILLGGVGGKISRYSTDGTMSGIIGPISPDTDSQFTTVAVQPNGQIVVGGNFRYNSSRVNIARYNSDGTLNTTVTTATNATYSWNTGATGPSLTATASGIYSATVTADESTAISNNVVVTVAGVAPVPIAVRATPTGPLTLCPGTTQTLTATAVYPAFTAGTGFNNQTRTTTLQPDGKVVVGGFFTSYNGTTRGRIARLNTDGTLDASFVPSGSGFNSYVRTTALQDGKVLVGGAFTSYNGVTRNYIARLNTDGTLDPSFAPTGTGADDLIQSITIQPDNKVLIGGQFGSYNGITRKSIARLNADGTLDDTFAPTGTGLNSTVNSVIVQPADGKILVGGAFTNYNGSPRNYIARLNADGTLDPSFAPTGTGLNEQVSALALQSDGKLLVGGFFTSYNGSPRGAVVRLNTNGTLDTSFAPVGTGLNNTILTIAVQADGKVLVGGTFTSYNGSPRNYIARLNSNGTLDATFALPGAGLNNAVFSISLRPNESMVVGGTFTSYDATPRNFIAQLDTKAGLSNTATPVPAANVTYAWRNTTTNAVTAGASLPVSAAGRYLATARVGGVTAVSDTVQVNLLPDLAIDDATPNEAAPGASVKITGTNLSNIVRVSFNNVAAAFTVISATELQVIVPTNAEGIIYFTDACGDTRGDDTFRVLPSITALTPSVGSVGVSVKITGTGFTPSSTVKFNNAAATAVTFSSATELIATVPPGATTGKLTVSTPSGNAATADDFVVLSTASGNQAISESVTLPGAKYPATSYANLTISSPNPASPVIITLNRDLTISGRMNIGAGVTLIMNQYRILSGGTNSNFTLATGAALATSNTNGISGSDPTGAVQTNSRSFSPDASYSYTGTGNSVTGNGLPSRVRNLTANLSGRSTLTLTAATSIAQVLTVADNNILDLAGQSLTLLSGPDGTALVNNNATGVVKGAATVQRYINPASNPRLGFRYYGSPVKEETVAALQKAGALAVYDYDQKRPASQRETQPLIAYGFSPASLASSAPLEVGHGYAADVPAATKVSFTGTLNNGKYELPLERDNSASAYYAGWHLVSNPYPSPLDWDKVAPTDRQGLEAAIYVYESTGPSTGYYRSYVNGAGTASPLIAAGQAFFVRVKKGQTSGTLIFKNSQRITEYDTQVSFNRLAKAKEQSGVSAHSKGNGCNSNGCRGLAATAAIQASKVTVYSDPFAPSTPVAQANFDSDYDAEAGDLQARNDVVLSITNDVNQELSIKGVRDMATAVFPLTLKINAPGQYVLEPDLAMLGTLPSTLNPYLYDKVASRLVNLRDSTFTVNLSKATDVLNPIVGRFELRFSKPTILGTTTPWSKAGSVEVYPNPAHEQVKVWVPAVAGAPRLQATLLNSLGQVVRQQDAALPAAGTPLQLDVNTLADGVYILRLQAGTAHVVRRIIVQH